MPILPLDHPEPFAATLGVMLYPGEDESDRRKARAFAAQYLAEPLRRLHQEGGSLRYEALLRIASDSGERLDDLDSRWFEATATGELFKLLFALFNTDPGLASWENAIKLAQPIAVKAEAASSRAKLQAARARFLSVAHLWGAWCIRERRFESRPDVGYDGWIDFQFFLAEAEILREWGQSWRATRDKSKPPLPPEVWRVPESWSPPEPQPGWPPTGRIPDLVVEPHLLKGLRRAGRPRSSR
jgi:hypothetical protein